MVGLRAHLPPFIMALTKTDICNLALSEIGNERVQISDFDTDTDKIARQCRLHYQRSLDELIRMHTWNCCKGRIKLCTTEVPEYPKTITVSDGQTLIVDQFDGADKLNENRPVYVDDLDTPTRQLSYTGTPTIWKYQRIDQPGHDVFTNDCDLSFPPKTGWSDGSLGADPITVEYDYYFGWSFSADLPLDCIRPVYITNSNSAWREIKEWTEWGIEERTLLVNYEDVWLKYIKEPAIADMDSLFLKAFYTLLASALAMPITGKREIKRELYDEFLNVIMPEARRVNSFEGYEQPMSDSEWLEATYTSPSQLSQSWPPFASGADYGSFNW